MISSSWRKRTRREGRAQHGCTTGAALFLGLSGLPVRRQAELIIKKIESVLRAAGSSPHQSPQGASPRRRRGGLSGFPRNLECACRRLAECGHRGADQGILRRSRSLPRSIASRSGMTVAARNRSYARTSRKWPPIRQPCAAAICCSALACCLARRLPCGLAQGDHFDGLSLRGQLQAGTIFSHADAIAKAAGTSMRNVVRINYWVSDIRDFAGVALAWAGRYGKRAPPLLRCRHAQTARSRRDRDGEFLVLHPYALPGVVSRPRNKRWLSAEPLERAKGVHRMQLWKLSALIPRTRG